MLTVTLQDANEVYDYIQKYDRLCMTISHDDTVLFRELDRGEPEDNTFWRDWAWVKNAVEKAYELGVQDGRNACGEKK